tara:strand:- start:158 stop:316 length:159 start_codon:yes stop_codon:yes gene_type:complete
MNRIKEWLTVWMYITMLGLGLVIVAVLMPFFAAHKMMVAAKDWWLFNKKEKR